MADTPEQFAVKLNEVQEGAEQAAVEFLRIAALRVGTRATGTYMRDAPGGGRRALGDHGPLRSLSGRLRRSLTTRGRIADTGGASETIFRVLTSGPLRIMEFGTSVEYAAIHEFGGLIRVTPRMRKFFWARWFETKDPFWKHMALFKDQIRMPARPYLRPALRDERERIEQEATERFLNIIQARIE